ncbi:MAG TPA: tetratricopeptide repeat protein [Bryobacteraceae bacterium]|nr:tetratricopeptide repeat protein [Bryobacteraceae bacterium]
MSELHAIPGCTSDSRVADVLFVHGLGGHPFETWRHGEDDSTSWPHWLAEEFPHIGVWSVEYSAAPFGNWSLFSMLPWTRKLTGYGTELPRQGRQILDRMALRGFGKRPLFFICHSLGGLVAKQILRAAHENRDGEKREIFAATRGVLFLGTPHRGATMASLFSKFRDNFGSTVTMEGLRAHDAHLEDLALWFRNTMPRDGVAIHSYFEELPVGPALIVNSTSADAGCGADPIGLAENHLSIAKPKQKDAHVCEAARRMLRKFRPAPPTAIASSHSCVAGMRPATPHFVGREEELRQLLERLRQRKSCAVVAPAGYGKTELAAQALERIERENGLAALFPDGVFVLDLYVLHGAVDSIWHSLATAVAGEGAGEQSPSLTRVRHALVGKRLLVVIEGGEEADGKEGRIAIAPLLAEIAGNNRWLLLTRNKLQVSAPESVSIGAPLSVGESTELFAFLTSGVSIDEETRTGILQLVQGHPLALRWAAAHVASAIDHPQTFLRDWKEDASARLADPTVPLHTLSWLFERTTRHLDETSLLVLDVAGKMAYIAFSLAAIASALCLPEPPVRESLRLLARLQLLRVSEAADHWQFIHVLAYQFARRRSGLPPAVFVRLGGWCRAAIERSTGGAGRPPEMEEFDAALAHGVALLDADEDHVAWKELGEPGLYRLVPRVRELGSIGKAQLLLSAIATWMKTLPPEEASSDRWAREFSSVLNIQGQALRDQGDLPGALQAFQQSLQICHRLADSEPSNTEWQRDLSISLDNIGKTRRDQGDLPGALQAFQESLQVRQRLADSDASNTLWQRDLSIVLDNIGNVRRAQGDLPGAFHAFQESFLVCQQLADSDPSNTLWQRDLSIGLNNMGNAWRDQGDLPGALHAFQQSFLVRQRLADSDASNTLWQRDLSIGLNSIGKARRDQGDLPGALHAFQQSLQICHRLADSEPSNTLWQRDLSIGLDNVGNARHDQGDLPGALQAFQQSLQVRQGLADSDPSNTEWQRDLSIGLNNIGNTRRDQGDLPGALQAFQQSLQVRQRLTDSDPSNTQWQRDLSIGLENIGNTRRDQGNLPGALQSFQWSLQVRQRLADSDPSNTQWQRDLSVSLTLVAECLEQAGKPSEARELAMRSLAIDERLAVVDPTNATWQNDVAFSRRLVERLRAAAISGA